MKTNQERETEERIAVLVTNLWLLALQVGLGARAPCPPWLRLWPSGQKVCKRLLKVTLP